MFDRKKKLRFRLVRQVENRLRTMWMCVNECVCMKGLYRIEIKFIYTTYMYFIWKMLHVCEILIRTNVHFFSRQLKWRWCVLLTAPIFPVRFLLYLFILQVFIGRYVLCILTQIVCVCMCLWTVELGEMNESGYQWKEEGSRSMRKTMRANKNETKEFRREVICIYNIEYDKDYKLEYSTHSFSWTALWAYALHTFSPYTVYIPSLPMFYIYRSLDPIEVFSPSYTAFIAIIWMCKKCKIKSFSIKFVWLVRCGLEYGIYDICMCSFASSEFRIIIIIVIYRFGIRYEIWKKKLAERMAPYTYIPTTKQSTANSSICISLLLYTAAGSKSIVMYLRSIRSC